MMHHHLIRRKMNILSRKAYHAIHEMIVTGEIAASAAISEESLARRLKISRTPVREAVRQLTQEGLLEQIPRRGTMVRSLGRQELAEIYDVREALESHAAARAAGRITARQLAQLELLVEEMGKMVEKAAGSAKQQLEREEFLREMALDKSFHLLILEAAGNRRMIEMLRVTRTLSDFFRIRLQAQPRRLVGRTFDHHKRILDALRARDAAGASAAMSEHVRFGTEDALKHFDQMQFFPGKTSEAVFKDLPGSLRKKLAVLGKE